MLNQAKKGIRTSHVSEIACPSQEKGRSFKKKQKVTEFLIKMPSNYSGPKREVT